MILLKRICDLGSVSEAVFGSQSCPRLRFAKRQIDEMRHFPDYNPPGDND